MRNNNAIKQAVIFSLIVLTGETAWNQEKHDTVTRLRTLASERWHTWRKERDRFPIAAWSYFHRYDGTKSEFETYEDANMTLVMPSFEQYRNAAPTGLDIALGQFQPLHEDRKLLEKTVAFPSPDDSKVIAYILKDEPLTEDYPALGEAVAYIYENDRRNAIPIIDFRPNWSVPYNRWNMTYETYFGRFIDEVHPCVLLNCHYPIMRDGSTRPVFYANIEWFRKKALEYDIGLMGFVLVTAHRFPGNPNIDYRPPSESDLRWMAYTYLAYGAQGLWYYNWRISKDERFQTSIVDGETGEPTEFYPTIASLNEEILAIGPTLLKLRSTEVYHTGKVVPVGTTRYYEGFVRVIHDWTGDDFIIGEFVNNDDQHDTGIYIMIVNKQHGADTAPRDLRRTARFRVYPNFTTVECLQPGTGETYSLQLNDGLYTLDVNGGQGVLMRFGR